jgi:tRNA threonylcarbamoyladenosine biosynthesis protein TsaB
VIVLGIDTALTACQAAVLDGERVLASASEPMQRGHQERLAAMVQEVLAEAELPFGDLERIAVTTGPGSFTGVRVGLAFAKGLALALGIPLAGIGTLQAIAASAARQGRITAVIDAKRGQVYLQAFEDGVPLGDPEALALEDARGRVGGLLVGPGAGLFEGPEGAVPLEVPDPVVVARLAAAAIRPAAPPKPIYLRAPDARPSA